MRIQLLSHHCCDILLLLLLLIPKAKSFVLLPLTGSGILETFNWSTIEPQQTLRYTPCYNGLQCARLLVPLDWTRPGSEPWQEVALAVARLPATVNQSDPNFGGTIILNPGGPSGSGVDLLREDGKGIQQIVDGEKHFEILSFDPRGTKYFTPSPACFDLDADRDRWKVYNSDVGSLDDGSFSLNIRWALAQGLAQLCDQTKLGVFPDGSNIRQYLSTAQVAHDMVRLTDTIDEELKNTTATTSSFEREASNDQTVLSDSQVVPLLNYWGYSYGTFLGNTFASMFPNRIGRVILDGVVDAADYSASGWLTNLQDNNLVWDFFFQWCFEAGPACALFSDDYQSASDIREKFTLFTNLLMEHPLAMLYDGKIRLLTYHDLQEAMHYGSYAPYQSWPNLALSLQQLIRADYEAFMLGSNATNLFFATSPLFSPLLHAPYRALDSFSNGTAPVPSGYPHGLEASTAILCGDGDDITSDTKTDFLSYLDELKNQSALVGSHWAQNTLHCRHWPRTLRPVDRNRYTGPFGTKLKNYQNDGRSSPILFIGNTADPVTPLRNAVKMARQHEGSRVLVQNAPGHCSGVNIPSNCTWNVISDFYNHGILPENGTHCEVDWQPWDLEPSKPRR